MALFEDLEHTVVGGTFVLFAALFYFWAVPRYVSRHVGAGKAPPLPSGRVPVAGFGVLDILGVSVVFGWYGAHWVASGAEGSLPESGRLPLLLLSQFVLQAMMGGTVLMFLFWRMDLQRAFGLRWRQWPWVLLIAPLSVFVIWSFMGALHMGGYEEWISNQLGEDPRQEAVKLLGQSSDAVTIGLMVLVACVGAPLAEELVFRGYLYGVLKRFTNIPLAVFLSGLLFGAVHLNLAALPPLFVLGMLLAVLYEVTGSLWAPVAVHFLFNAGTVAVQILGRFLPEFSEMTGISEALVRPW